MKIRTGAGVKLGGNTAGQDITGLGRGLHIEEADAGGEIITGFEGGHVR